MVDSLKYRTVTFKSNGGSAVPTQQLHGDDKEGKKPTDPTRTGYIFTGWHSDSNLTDPVVFPIIVNRSITLYAKWVPVTYTVIYDKNASGASGSTASSNHTYDVKKALTENGFVYSADFFFAGWSTSPNGVILYGNKEEVVNLASTEGAVVTLYARWSATHNLVTFYANGGTPAPAMQDIWYNEKVVEPPPMTRTGYTFDGWYTEPYYYNQWDFNNDTVIVPVYLYAKWNINQYTVTFVADGGTPTPAPQTISYNSYVLQPTINKTGYTFGGWYSNINPTTEYSFSTPVTGNITLSAKWFEIPSLNITFAQITAGGAPLTIPSSLPSTIYRSRINGPTEATLTLQNPTQYSSYNWIISGTSIVGNASTFTLDSTIAAYLSTGEHFVTIIVIQSGVPYTRTISFTVAP